MSLNKQSSLLSYFIVFVLALSLYAFTCAPGALWQDSGMYQYRIWHNDIEGRLGLALAHPLYHIIGIAVKYLPIGEFGFRVNFLSALFGAVTVANIFLLVRLWLGKISPALIAAVTLAVSWTFWQHSAIAEVYTLYTAIFSAEFIFLLLYCRSEKISWLYLVAFCNGLSIANHLWGVLPLACYVVLAIYLAARKRINIKNLILIMLLWIVGALPYLYLIVLEMIQTGDIAAALSSAMFGKSYSGMVLNVRLTSGIVLQNLMFIGYNFATPNILLAAIGIAALKKASRDKLFNVLLAAVTLIFFVFAFRYTVPDRYAFFIPFYCLVSIFIGAGAKILLEKFSRKWIFPAMCTFSVLPVMVYTVAPHLAQKHNIGIPTKRTIPYRNDYTYFLRPWQFDGGGAENFAKKSLEATEPDSVIIADGTTVYPLWYVQTFGKVRGDVRIMSSHGSYENPEPFPTPDSIYEYMLKTPVYVVSPVKGYCPDCILDNYDFIPQGPIYRVVEKKQDGTIGAL